MDRETYENVLKNDFRMLPKLQNCQIEIKVGNKTIRTNKIITIEYEERDQAGRGYKSILLNPTSRCYPNRFRVTYKMPMIVGYGQIKEDWSGTFLLNLEKDNWNTTRFFPAIEGGWFPDGSVPYNNHINKGSFCAGAAWEAAQHGGGIFFLIIGMGCILNQEKWIMDLDQSRKHFNTDAFKYWKDVRKMEPNNKINWPYNLIDIDEQSKFTVGEIKNVQHPFIVGTIKDIEQPKFTVG